MTSLPGFRPPRPRPVPPGALETAITAGLRRRRRAALLGGGVAGTAAVVAFAVMAQGAGGASTLTPLDTPPYDLPSRKPAVTSPAPTTAPRTSATATKPAQRTVAPPPAAKPIRTTIPPTPTQLPSPSSVLMPWHKPATEREVAYLDRPFGEAGSGGVSRGVCAGGGQDRWCFYLVTGSGTVAPDDPMTIDLALCRSGEEEGTVEYHDEQDFDIEISDGTGRVVWRWSTGMLFSAGLRFRTLAYDRCVVWTTTWNGTDDLGRPVSGPHWVETYALGTDAQGKELSRHRTWRDETRDVEAG